FLVVALLVVSGVQCGYMYIFGILLTLIFSPPGAALGFDVTFLSVNVREAEKITWKKDDRTLVEWDTTTKDPKYLIKNKVSLDCVSGNLTVKNVEEKDKGKYILVAKGDRTTTEEFSLTYQ
ncbi:hypothetical protein GDO78_019645, partial [Eleutherodactylus coqui]